MNKLNNHIFINNINSLLIVLIFDHLLLGYLQYLYNLNHLIEEQDYILFKV